MLSFSDTLDTSCHQMHKMNQDETRCSQTQFQALGAWCLDAERGSKEGTWWCHSGCAWPLTAPER